MAIQSGSHLGPYGILFTIGAGVMGEVYRDRDRRLERTVAIKVLAPNLSSNPEHRQRFEREARTVAALNNPHLCPVYNIGFHDGFDYLVMEFLEGENLASRIAKGRLHRDLKPGKIMLTKTPFSTTGLIRGTVPQVAPEQLEGAAVGPRSNLNSFDLVLNNLSDKIYRTAE